MNESAKNLLVFEMNRVKELVDIIDNTEVIPYDFDKKYWDEQNLKSMENESLVRQARAELKQRLTMLRKDCILVRKSL